MGLVMQWTFDPKGAPEARNLTEGLRRVMEAAASASAASGT